MKHADNGLLDGLSSGLKNGVLPSNKSSFYSAGIKTAKRYIVDELSKEPLVAYSFRQLRRKYNDACVQIIRASDSVEKNFGFDRLGVCRWEYMQRWLNGAGTVPLWYDQMLNYDVSQAVLANQPIIDTTNRSGGYVSSDYLQSSLFSSVQDQKNTISLVAKIDTPTATDVFIDGAAAGRNIIAHTGVGFYMWSGANLIDGARDTTKHVFTAIFDNLNSQFYIDGTLVASGNSGNQGMAAMTIGADYTGGLGLVGKIDEVLFFNDAITNDDRLLLEANQKEFYGTP